jgi:glucan phosphoethanolaminetransferase (alkaline phosphatase superfamily)
MEVTILRHYSVRLLIGYGVQFVAGMVLNLFVVLPASHPGSTGAEYFSRSLQSLLWTLSGGGGGALAAHVYIALILTIGAIGLLVLAIRARHRVWIVVSSVAAFFTVGAFFNGLSFTDYGADISSFIMATCWLVAVGAVVIGLIKTTKA